MEKTIASELTVCQRQRERLLEVVTQVGLLGAMKLPLDGLLREVVRTAQRLVRGSGAAVAIRGGSDLHYRAVGGLLERHQELRVPVTDGLSGLALECRSIVYSAQIQSDARAGREPALQVGARSMLVAPLLHGVDASGVLQVVAENEDGFDEIDEHAVQMCAQFVAGVVGRQQAVEDYQRLATEHAAALRQVQTVLAASPAPTIVHDLDGRIRMWNPAAERLLGWSEPEVIGSLPPYVPPGEMPSFMEFTRRIVAGSREPPEPVTRRTKDGRTIKVRVTGAPLVEPSGAVTGVVRVLEAVS